MHHRGNNGHSADVNCRKLLHDLIFAFCRPNSNRQCVSRQACEEYD